MDGFDFLGIWTIMQGLGERVRNILPRKTVIIEQKPKKYSYRPDTLDKYIGQERAKEQVRLSLRKILTTKNEHILIDGAPGFGKTTLAKIISNHLSMEMKYYIAGSFTLDNLISFLKANEISDRPLILMLDELHAINKDVAEILYPILEDGEINGKEIRKFVMIGATTNKYVLIKKLKPLCDRMARQITLSEYSVENIIEILKQYVKQVYSKEISDEDYLSIATNSRLTPRVAISMIDDFVICGNTKSILDSRRIVKNSLTDIDIKILKYLSESKGGSGEEALAIVAGIERSDFHYVVEPYLLSQGYTARGSRRTITEKGKELLKSL